MSEQANAAKKLVVYDHIFWVAGHGTVRCELLLYVESYAHKISFTIQGQTIGMHMVIKNRSNKGPQGDQFNIYESMG